MRRWCVVLLAASGCAQLAGIDETTGGDSGTSSVAVEQIFVGATVVRAPLDLTGATATYLVEDPAGPGGFTRVEATQEGTLLTADLEAPAPVLVTLPLRGVPTPVTLLVDVPTPDVTLTDIVYAHPDPQPSPAGATLTVDVTLDAAYNGEPYAFQLWTVGTWTRADLGVPAVGAQTIGPLTLPYSDMQRLTAGPHEKLTAADVLVALRYTGTQLTGAAAVAAPEQTGTDSASLTLAPVTPDQPLVLDVQPAMVATRFAAARPMFGAPAFQWLVNAAPGARIGADLGPTLNSGAFGTDVTQIQAPYGNPFADRGWDAALSVYASALRTYTSAMGLTYTLSATLLDRSLATGAAQPVEFGVGFPERIAVNQTSLSTDNVMIPFPVAPVTIELETDRPDNTVFQISLVELTPNADNTALQGRIVVTAFGTAPQFQLPPELFQAGRLYFVRAVVAKGGFPSVASGNFADLTVPSSLAQVDSGVFGVMP